MIAAIAVAAFAAVHLAGAAVVALLAAGLDRLRRRPKSTRETGRHDAPCPRSAGAGGWEALRGHGPSTRTPPEKERAPWT